MRKPIYLCAIIALLMASCDSPLSNVGNPQQAPDISSVIPSGATRAEVDSIRSQLWRKFQATNGASWQIRKSERTGLPVSIFAGLTSKTYTGSPKEVARAFLADHIALFGFESLKHLHYTGTQRHRGVSSVSFRQYYKGVPVAGAEFKVHIRRTGKIGFANGYYYPNITVSPSPSLSANSAISSAKQDLGLASLKEQHNNAELFVLPRKNGSFSLIWKVHIFEQEPFTNQTYFIDAHTGHIIRKRNDIEDAMGAGNVFPEGRCRSSVAAKSLYRLDNSGYLNGLYVDVYNAEASRAYSSSLVFNYSILGTHFGEVSLYYYIDTFRANFIEGLDSQNNLFVSNVKAYAHDSVHTNNATWSYSNGINHLYFRDGFAKVGKVAYHEYSHGVVFDINSGIRADVNEEGAIGEGVPDYFAGSFTDYAKILDCTLPFATRDMENPDISSYTEYQNIMQNEGEVDEYKGAEFFSSILWDIRSKIGASVADVLVYDALYRVTASPDFLEFRDAMISADDYVYGGQHFYFIRNTFASWGVGSYAPLGLSIDGPLNVIGDKSASWTAHIQDPTATVSYYQWTYRWRCAGLTHPCTWSSWHQLSGGENITVNFYDKVDAPAQVELKVYVPTNHQAGEATTLIGVYKCAFPKRGCQSSP